MGVATIESLDRSISRSLLTLVTAAVALTAVYCGGGDGTGPPPPDTTPAAIAIVSGDGQKGLLGSTLSSPLRVRVTNAAGSGLSDVTVNFSVVSGSATLSATSAATTAGGTAEVTVTLGSVGELNTIRASVSGVATPADFMVTALAPTTIEVSAGDGLKGPAGSALATAFEARVRDQETNTLGGVDVFWTITDSAGPGATLDTDMSVTNAAGIATATLTLGSAGGNYAVSAAFTGAATPATFTATALVADSIEIAGGSGQAAPITGTLPNPLQVLVRDQLSDPFSGVTVDWAITAAAGAGAALGSATSVTDASGVANNTLTLGGTDGTYEVTATFVGLAKPPAVFTATANLAPVITSITPSPVREGFAATITGSNLDPVPANNTVIFDGVTATVTGGTATTLDIVVPASACLPARDAADFAVSIAGVPGPSFFHPAIPGDSSVSLLPVAAADIRSDPASVECVQFPAQGAGSLFLVVPAVTTSTSGVTASERNTRTVGSSMIFGTGGFDILASSLDTGESSSRRRAALQRLERHREFESRLRAYARELMRRAGDQARAALGARAMRPNYAAAAAQPMVGDTIPLNVPVGPTNFCDQFVTVGAVVKSIGTFGIAVEDTAAPAGGFTVADYNAFVAEFDAAILPTDTLYFGGVSDIDANGQVILHFTPEVNKAGAGGFFFAGDLFPTANCAGSNIAEVVYVLVPDPMGIFGPAFPTAFLRQANRGILAHEVQHLINAAQRVFVTMAPTFEEIWLDEGLSHISEEVVGHAVTGLTPGSNLDFAATALAFPDEYTGFYQQNFLRLDNYLANPGANSPIDADADGATRGAIWNFLRWILDQEATPPTETSTTRALVITTLSGVANLEAAVAPKVLEDLLPEWLLALFADDFVAGVDPRLTIPSWHMRDIYANIPPGGYPLATTVFGYADGTTDYTVRSGSGVYFLVASGGASPAMSMRFTTQAGSPLDPSLLPRTLLMRLP